MRLVVTLLCALAVLFATPAYANDADCEVCIPVITKLSEAAKEKGAKDLEDYEKSFRKTCKSFTNPKEKRICWYLGGAEDSATNILREVSRPLSIGVPPESICRRLKAKDASICSLRYSGNSVTEPEPEKKKSTPKPKVKKAKKVDWDNISKLRVKELRALLADLGETCPECVEKGDFVKKILSLRPKDGAADKAEL